MNAPQTSQTHQPAPTRGRGPYGLTAAQVVTARRNLAIESELSNGQVIDVKL